LQLQTEHLIPANQRQKLIGDRPLQIDRYKTKKLQIERRRSESGSILKLKLLQRSRMLELALLEPPMQVAEVIIELELRYRNSQISRCGLWHHNDSYSKARSHGFTERCTMLTGGVYAVDPASSGAPSSKTLTWYVLTKLEWRLRAMYFISSS